MPKKAPEKKNQWKSFSTLLALSFSIFIFGIFSTQWVIQKIGQKDVAYGLRLFQEDWSRRTEKNAEIMVSHFNIIYNSLRTIAMLPGVKRIDRYGTNLEEDSKITLQQIYNNLFSSISVSEIYLVPEDLDPEKIDPVTGKLETPIMTFDNFITEGGSENEKKTDPEKPTLEEVEIFEYREMKKQLDYFHRYFPNVGHFKALNLPALISSEVITCDNSEFTQHDLETKNDKPRLGILYSVPFYGNDGNLKGMVTSVFRTTVWAKLLEDPYFIFSSNHRFSLFHKDTPQQILKDLPALLEEEDLENYAFIKSISVPVKDEGRWKITAAVPFSAWLDSSIYESIKLNSRWTWIIGIILSFSFAALSWILMYSRTRAMNMLNEMRAALESSQRQLFQGQKSDLLTKVTREMANDFQNHITPILAYTNLLLSKLPPDSSEFRKMEVIKKSAEKAVQVIQQLLSISKVVTSNKHKMNVSEVLTKTDGALAQMLQGKVDVTLETPPDLWSISGDAEQIENILMNLAFNARDAMPDGGVLNLKAENVIEDKKNGLGVPQLSAGYYIKLQVSDTGKGMPEDMLNKIFDPSFKRNKKNLDTGDIKLFTLHAIVSDHKGIILVESEIGHGTTFTLYFPALVDKSMEALLAQQAASAPPVEPVPPPPPPSSQSSEEMPPETVSPPPAEETPPASADSETDLKTTTEPTPISEPLAQSPALEETPPLESPPPESPSPPSETQPPQEAPPVESSAESTPAPQETKY